MHSKKIQVSSPKFQEPCLQQASKTYSTTPLGIWSLVRPKLMRLNEYGNLPRFQHNYKKLVDE